jgi:PBP1b-binding outer membrane lipoprotein LpoB
MKKIFIPSMISIIFFSGCVTKEYANKSFENRIKYNYKVGKNVDFQKIAKERLKKDNFIDFSINKDLKSALKSLNSFDKNNIYLLKDTQNNIVFPQLSTKDSEKLKINTFLKLKKFVEKISPYTLSIKGNPFKKGIKVVEVINKEKLKSTLYKHPIKIKGEMTLKDAITLISKTTGYSVIFDNAFDVKQNGEETAPPPAMTENPTDNESSSVEENSLPINLKPVLKTKKSDLDLNKKIIFTGNTIGELLTYLSNQFNYFVDIDYKNKLIVFKKYKTFTFNLILPDDNIDIDPSFLARDLEKRTEEFLKTIQTFVKDGVIDYSNGIIYAYLTKKDFQKISGMVNTFNKDILRTAKLKIEIYTFIVKRNSNIGLNLSIVKKALQTKLSYLSITPATITTNNGKIKYGININNQYLFLANKSSYYYRIANKIPLFINLSKNQNYIKSLKVTTTSSTSTTTQIQTEIGEIEEGKKFVILPSIYSNKVILKILYSNSANENLKEVKVGNNTVMLPTNSKQTFPSVATLNIGERKIIGIYQTYESIDNFNGTLPPDLLITRLPGNTNKKYIKELIAVVVTLEK